MEDQDHWPTLGGVGVRRILDDAQDDVRNIRFLDERSGAIVLLART
jgi:hypothetical protein